MTKSSGFHWAEAHDGEERVPHAYCTSCDMTVTVRDRRCLAGHPITHPIDTSGRGRHRAPRRWEVKWEFKPKKPHLPRHAAPPPVAAEVVEPAPPRPSELPAAAAKAPKPPAVTPLPERPRQTPTWQEPAPAPRPVYNSSLLEMLGLGETTIDYRQPETMTTAASPAPVWQPPVPVQTIRRAGLEELPTLSDMRIPHDHTADTGTLIERLWIATEEHEAVRPAEQLKAEEFKKITGRTYRWPIVVAVVATLGVAITLLVIGNRLPARLAEETQATYRTAVAEAQAVLPVSAELVAAISNPTFEPEELSDAAVMLSQLDDAARNLFTTASPELPATPPLVGREPLEALNPVRTDMAAASDQGLTIERRLGLSLSYRLIFARAFELPDLPSTATSDEISALGVELGLSLATTLDILAQLPSDPLFAAHRNQAEQLAARYADWQVEYLNALREGNLDTAVTLLAEIDAALAGLDQQLTTTLQSVQEWGSTELDRFDQLLTDLHLELVPGPFS